MSVEQTNKIEALARIITLREAELETAHAELERARADVIHWKALWDMEQDTNKINQSTIKAYQDDYEKSRKERREREANGEGAAPDGKEG